MRILHTSDWHIGKSVNEYSLLEEQNFFVRQLIACIVSEHIDVLLIAGDLYDRSVPSAEAVSLVNKAFTELILDVKIPVIVISGNHDSRERLEFLNDLYEITNLYVEGMPKKEVKKVTLSDEHGPVHFYLLPYLDPYTGRKIFEDPSIKTYDEVYEAAYQSIKPALNTDERNVLVAHGFFNWIDDQNPSLQETVFSESEISVGGSDLVNIKRFAEFDYIALGHLHSPQKIAQEHIRYSGSILKYSVSEANQKKGVCIVECNEKGNIAVEQRELPVLRDLRIVKGSFDELCNRELQKNQNLDDYVFAHLTDTEMIVDGVNKLKAVYSNILGLQYLNLKQNEYASVQDVHSIHSKSALQLYGDFYESIFGEPLEEERKKMMEEIIFDAERSL